MPGQTKIAERVRALIERLSPDPICDGCIASRLELGDPIVVAQAASALAGLDGFERSRDACTICGDAGSVIRKR
jgi:hypothetical protein